MRENCISIKDKIQLLSEKSVSLKEYQIKGKDSFLIDSSGRTNNLKNKEEIFYPLAQSTWDYSEQNAIIDQLYTGNLTMGEKVENFERSFAEFFGVKYAIMVNSGSSANL